MLDAVVAVARFVQYLAAAMVFGLPAFRLYGIGGGQFSRAERWLLSAAAVALAGGAVAALAAQSAAMTGDPTAASDPSAWWAVGTGTQFGRAVGVRLALALAALALALVAPRRWLLVAVGGCAMASFAWSGHGAAGDGWSGRVQLAADVAHLLAAGLWLGALAGLGLAANALRGAGAAMGAALIHALEGFAGIGSALVAILLVTGAVNGWILVTPARAPDLLGSPYGVLLALKIGLFGTMLGCAVLNRFRLTPALRRAAGDPGASRTLRWSLAVETLSGVGVVALVAVLGMLPPPAAMG
jgi:putative copper resistance protein D